MAHTAIIRGSWITNGEYLISQTDGDNLELHDSLAFCTFSSINTADGVFQFGFLVDSAKSDQIVRLIFHAIDENNYLCIEYNQNEPTYLRLKRRTDGVLTSVTAVTSTKLSSDMTKWKYIKINFYFGYFWLFAAQDSSLGDGLYNWEGIAFTSGDIISLTIPGMSQ